MLPPDNHVHSEWSWDAPGGSMEQTCARASAMGLPSVAFTEHADFTPWHLPPGGGVPDGFRCDVSDGVLTAPELDVDGYLACLERCRHRFPDLRILSGVELSEPHWHGRRSAELLDLAGFDRILGSTHSARTADGRILEVGHAYREQPAGAVVREYLARGLADAAQLVQACGFRPGRHPYDLWIRGQA